SAGQVSMRNSIWRRRALVSSCACMRLESATRIPMEFVEIEFVEPAARVICASIEAAGRGRENCREWFRRFSRKCGETPLQNFQIGNNDFAARGRTYDAWALGKTGAEGSRRGAGNPAVC